MPLTKVTRGALTADIIDSTKLADNAVDTEHLADDAVESAEIGENITFTGKYIGLPVFANNTARDAGITSPAAGMMCFNTAQAAVQQYTGAVSGWSDITPAPTFSGFSSGYAVINEDDDVTIKIDGSQLVAGMTVDMVNNANDTNVTNYGGLSYTLVSTSQISISIGAATNNITAGTVVYFNITKGGIAVKTSTITVSADPVWTTAAGNLGTVDDTDSSGTVATVAATSSDTVAYSSNDIQSYYDINSSTGVVSVDAAITDVSAGSSRTDAFNLIATADGDSLRAESRAFNIIVNRIWATGGNSIVTTGGYRYHTYTSTGNGSFIVNGTIEVEVLMIAGGGGGGGYNGSYYGGGGAGGAVYDSSRDISAGTYTVSVGAGGAGGVSTLATTGGDSTFNGLTAKGGGYGRNNNSPGAGGCGGGAGLYGGNTGASSNQTSSGTSSSGTITAYGNAGGAGCNYPNYENELQTSGGGGGIGEAGNTDPHGQSLEPFNWGGAGGDGLDTWSSWFTAISSPSLGDNGFIGGGGGGGAWAYAGGSGGDGGGGDGGDADTGNYTISKGEDGTANTGGGGGGAKIHSTGGGAGGSGLIIIRYAA